MEKITSEFEAYLTEQKELAYKEAETLFQDGRGDEGKFLKIKANMYDIFRALFQAARGQSKGDVQVCKELFLTKAQQVPQSWKKSLALAKEHQEVEKIMTEELKLRTSEEIINQFHQIYKQETGAAN